MPEVLRSATITIPPQDLPMGPPVLVIGRGAEGQTVCQVEINATGIKVYGPKGREVRTLNWDQLMALVDV